MIEVFKTDVQEVRHAERLVSLLQQHFPGSRVNFDLEDCDKVLRIEGNSFLAGKVMLLVHKHGYACEALE